MLSYVINRVCNKNFNQLLNEKHIEVVLKKLQKSQLNNLSMNSIAGMVGFQSRTTFNKAFKEKSVKHPQNT